MKLLLVEDDPVVADILTEALTAQHWIVECTDDGNAGLTLASNHEYDLIVLDIGLPNVDGLTICKQLRSRGYQNPILFLTGETSTDAQVTGLNAGADDYVTKPFDLQVFLARVRAVTRKGKNSASILTWRMLQLDSVSGQVLCHGKPVHLTAKEYGLLELFLLNPNRVYSRRAILDRLWDIAEAPGEETVSTHIKCIRQKLKLAGGDDPIETVHGMGYRLRSPE